MGYSLTVTDASIEAAYAADGTLTLEFMQGQRLTVPAPVPVVTWSVAPWSVADG